LKSLHFNIDFGHSKNLAHNRPHHLAEVSDAMSASANRHHGDRHQLNFVLPNSGKIFTEISEDFVLCKPHLQPIKSFTLEKLEKMQLQAHKQMQETRAKTAAAQAAN
jgi:Cilia BBSome complex subunit 10